MKKYKIRILDDANEDMKEIISYIKNKLKEPDIAKQHKSAFKEAILELKDSAGIYSPIDEELTGKNNIRKTNVKKFMIFYDIVEDESLVRILAVFYSKSNWQSKIKLR